MPWFRGLRHKTVCSFPGPTGFTGQTGATSFTGECGLLLGAWRGLTDYVRGWRLQGRRTYGVVVSIGKAADVSLDAASELVVPLPQLLHHGWRPLAWLLAMLQRQLLQHRAS